MRIFNRTKENTLAVIEHTEDVAVSVPDIKEYLVREYERGRSLQSKIEKLEAELESAREIKFKYDATIVTLEEYSNRIGLLESKIDQEREKTEKALQKVRIAKDEINTYKIKLSNAALTKEEIMSEIVNETKNSIIEAISAHKGNLSKKIVFDIISKEIR